MESKIEILENALEFILKEEKKINKFIKEIKQKLIEEYVEIDKNIFLEIEKKSYNLNINYFLKENKNYWMFFEYKWKKVWFIEYWVITKEEKIEIFLDKFITSNWKKYLNYF